MSIRLSLHNLTITYARHPAVHHVSGYFETGAFTAIIGPNGAGKSTLLKALMGLIQPAHGSIDYGGLDKNRIAYLPQQTSLDRQMPISVLDTILLGHWHRTGAWGRISSQWVEKARDALKQVGLAAFEAHPVGGLSVGQFQRVLFARLIVQDAHFLLLDEPFNAVDAQTTADLLALVEQWRTEGRTVISVLHDHALVKKWCPYSLLLSRECVAWGATDKVLTDSNLLRAQALAGHWVPTDEVCERDSTPHD